ncbi:MAG: hypothetical protein KGZ51_05870 [Erysipelothrix sp.]|jgi:hypothetical protein|nr:hypothetical protein [Erysipelothrix sp.]
MEKITEDTRTPFPQADDFEKIVRIVNINKVEKLKDKMYLSILLGNITERQVMYYMSACVYLGLIDDDKNFTELGKELRSENIVNQEVLFCHIITEKPVFRYIYFFEKYLGSELEKDEIISLMKKFEIVFDSEEIYKRRSSTVRKWINWIKRCSINSSGN